jgi:hypothetical protein
MIKTNILVNGVDLSDIFSSDLSNNIYSSDSKLNNLSLISSPLLVGTNPTGITIQGSDAVTIFSPIFTDVSSYGVTVVNIPSWVSKIGFVVQASGGAGGVAFTNYWQYIHKPIRNIYSGHTRIFTSNIVTVQTSVQGVTYSHDSYSTGSTVDNTIQYHINFQTTYNRTYSNISTTVYGSTYQTNYTTTYTRSGVQNSLYYGSSGGGGGCSAGVYVINGNDRPATLTIINNFNNKYAIQFSDSVTTNAIAYNGTDVISNSSSGSNYFPIQYMTDLSNTSIDVCGSGGTATINDPTGYITSKYTVSGSPGVNTSGQSIVLGGSGGFDASQSISTNFLPAIKIANRGTGGNGTSDINIKNYGKKGVVRYWFIR